MPQDPNETGQIHQKYNQATNKLAQRIRSVGQNLSSGNDKDTQKAQDELRKVAEALDQFGSDPNADLMQIASK